MLVAVALLASLAPPSPSIHVTPLVMLEGQPVRVQCRVPLSPANRRLIVALEDYRYSEVPLSENGPVTTEITYEHVPCDVERASCTIVTASGSRRTIAVTLTIVCRG